MNFENFLLNTRNFAIAFVIFLLIDMVWLLFIGKGLYQKHLGFLMADKVNLLPALLFYVIFVIALVFFVINPALAKESITHVILGGLIFGLVTYATYDLTNLATIQNWPLLITIVDLIWGSFVSIATSLISYLIISRL